ESALVHSPVADRVQGRWVVGQAGGEEQATGGVDRFEGDIIAEVEAAEGGEVPAATGVGQGQEALAGLGEGPIEGGNPEGAVEAGRAADIQAIELGARAGAADLDEQGSGRGLGVVAGDSEGADRAAGADLAGVGHVPGNGADSGERPALDVYGITD